MWGNIRRIKKHDSRQRSAPSVTSPFAGSYVGGLGSTAQPNVSVKCSITFDPHALNFDPKGVDSTDLFYVTPPKEHVHVWVRQHTTELSPNRKDRPFDGLPVISLDTLFYCDDPDCRETRHISSFVAIPSS